MLLCDHCNKEVRQGLLCSKCKRVVCRKCSNGEDCSLCKEPLVSFRVESEKMNGCNVQWIRFNSEKQFGLVRFKEFPAFAYCLVPLLPSFSADYKLILFASSRVSKNFARHQSMGKKEPVFGSNRTTIKGSRYTLLFEPSNEAYVLLNAVITKESDAPFLVKFLNGLFGYIKEQPLNDFQGAEKVGYALLESMHQYNKKFGLEWVSASTDWKELSINIFVKLRTAYLEHLALKNLSANDNFEGEISEYASNKIRLIFNAGLDFKPNAFSDLLNIIGIYTDALCILTSLANIEQLHSAVKSKFKREDWKIEKKLADQEDVKEALEEIKKTMSDVSNYSSFQVFLEATCTNLVNFFTVVKPKYMWWDGAEPLAKACKVFLEGIEGKSSMQHPQFGDIEAFMSILSKVFEKCDSNSEIYPEPSIECGFLLLELLESLVRFQKSEYYFGRALSVGQKLADMIERNGDIIKKKNPQSLFDHLQAATVLTGLVTMCINFKKWDIAIRLLDEAKALAQKNELIEIELRTYWTKFLLTQDYEELLQVYKLHLGASNSKEPDYAFPQRMALLLSGLFEQKDRIKHFQEAADLSSSLVVEDQHQLTTTDSLDHLFVQRLNYYLCNLFLNVAKAEKGKDQNAILNALLKAKPFALALEAEANMPMASENVFSWKTLLLIGILTKNVELVEDCIRKLKAFPIKSITNESFLKKAEMLFRPNNLTSLGDKFDVLSAPTETRDLWCRLLERIIEFEFESILKQRLKLVSRGILFVEGPTEEEILPIIADKIGINLKERGIEIVSLGGSAKAKLTVRFWRKITRNVSLPLFMLLDYDAKEYAKKAIDEELLEKEHCFVLGRGTIEDYYPEEILAKSIEETCGKRPSSTEIRGKKAYAIDAYLKRNKYYGDWKIAIGTRVSQLINEKQVDPELKEILRKVLLASG